MRKRRSTALAAALTGAFLFTACGIIKTYPQVNTARFHSDLSLTMISAESMDREYYDLDQLQTVILDAVNDYNEKNPDAISIDYYHVEGELATLILTYQNADHCTAFNEQPVLYGPAAEAWEQGQMDGIGWISADTAMEEAARAETAAAATAAAAEETAEAGTTAAETAEAEASVKTEASTEAGKTAAETAEAEEPAEAGKTNPGTAKPASAEAAGGAGTGAAETAEAAGEAGTGAAQAAEAGASAMDLTSMRFIMLTEPLCVETEDPIAYVSGPVTVTDPHSCVTGEEIDENDPVYILLDTGAAGK